MQRRRDRPVTARQKEVIAYYSSVAPISRLDRAILDRKIKNGLSSREADKIITDLWRRYEWWVES